MADPEVKLKFVGNEAEALRAIANLEKRLEQLDQATRNMGRKNGGDDFNKMFMEMGQSILSTIGPLELARHGVELFRKEYQAMVEWQDKASGANTDFVRALQNLAQNTNDPLENVKQRLNSLSSAAKLAPADLANILNEAQAAKGQLDESAVDPTIIAAAALSRSDPKQVQNLVGVSLDIQKQVKGITPEQALGFALDASSVSRVADPKKFSENMMPAITQVAALNDTPIDYAAAIAAGISQKAGDHTGRRSAQAMVGLAIQLRDQFPELANMKEQLAALQKNPELANAFMNGGEVNGRRLKGFAMDVTGPDGQVIQLSADRAHFETKMKPAIEEIVNGKGFAWEMAQHSLEVVPKIEDADASYARRLRAMQADPNIQTEERKKLLEIRANQNLVENTDAADASIMRQGVDKTLESLGYGWTDRHFAGWNYYGATQLRGVAPKDAMIEVLRNHELFERKEERDGNLPASRRDLPRKIHSLIDELNPDEQTRARFASEDERLGLKPIVEELKEVAREIRRVADTAEHNQRANQHVDPDLHSER